MIIRHLRSEDRSRLPEILDLLNRTQGQGLFSAKYVEKFISGDDHKVPDVLGHGSYKARLFLAFEDSTPEALIIGAAGAEMIDNYDYYLPFDANINQRFAGKAVGSFATMTVHEKFQGQGIGQKLSQARLDWLKANQADFIVGVSWVSGLKHTSNRVFEKMGFKPVKQVEGFYTEYAKSHPFDCPGCKAQACTCAAVLYLKTL